MKISHQEQAASQPVTDGEPPRALAPLPDGDDINPAPRLGDYLPVTPETVRLALSAIRTSQERDYYANFAKAQRELEALL